MDIYEYKTIHFEESQFKTDFSYSIEKKLNDFGKEGWELASLLSIPQIGSTKYALIGITMNSIGVLKRKKKSE